MAAITTQSLVKEYPGGVRGVDEMDVTINDGEFFALLGPSGCGKTTLLRTIAGLEETTSGTISIGNRDVTDLNPGDRGVSMVFQDYALFPHMNVEDNIAYPMRVRKVAKEARHKVAHETGSGLALDGLMARRPNQLSGGQQQRVALARAVATRPDVLLLDEPLSNLDARLRLEARTFLKELQRDLGVTTVFVTHDQAEALALADRIAVMKSGKLQQLGTPREVFRRPSNTFVAGFIGSNPMNLVTTTLGTGTIRIGEQEIPLPSSLADLPGLDAGRSIVWGVRPEYLQLSEDPLDVSLTGEVTVVENLGASCLVSVLVGDTRLQVVVSEDDEPAPGTKVWVTASERHSLLFDTETTERITP
ncbi:carbohydrate ABC transporter ATP-binding protein, CUT1 family [Sanguibacter gelidistatuariae]|uniref:Carbohydrate ABC transporter ATP-binding protein, CUT1 family n=1 Tax=Sanguibacter gelidistatuariae TaxID=1814289 RepID=A0A1G6HUY8_9MICO|nr:ABC transporter ATP-binding protein [Sanguibacter gelidistatuariae]SDB98051.1 carbohydrate ABC transporter ATP-binding protein, CUT1 family [Sanguibacter gelidistatuariae]